ncbi:hypothetical protein quinque_010339 [Culex quinquefasciatus]
MSLEEEEEEKRNGDGGRDIVRNGWNDDRWLANPSVDEATVEVTELSVRKCDGYPGTYCGQRCPCYVISKSCLDLVECRGCWNLRRDDGRKVRPHIPELQNLEINLHNATASETLSIATTIVLSP